MRDRPQFFVTEETAGAFNRVDGAKDARQAFAIVRCLFQLDQIEVQPAQVLVALDKEFARDRVQIVHQCFPKRMALRGRL